MTILSKNNFSHGFLYCPESQQILLQQKNLVGQSPLWTLLEDLKKFHPKNVLPIYDYVVKGEKHTISYAEVKKVQEFPAKHSITFRWFSVKELTKIPISSQTKQDLIVGRRVIDSQIRKVAGERTIG